MLAAVGKQLIQVVTFVYMSLIAEPKPTSIVKVDIIIATKSKLATG